jgi:hydrogenase nickel insertion protein HypA
VHELPILRDILAVALRHAASAGVACRVVAIDLAVGELRDLDAEWMQRYFRFVSAGTAAADATLRVTRSRALLACLACGVTSGFDLRAPQRACPACASPHVELSTGNELRIESIDVAEAVTA